MADLVPVRAPGFGGGSPLSEGSVLTRLSSMTQQPAVRKMLPVFIGLSAIGGAALTWSLMAPTPQRVLYAQLDDSERAGVAGALDGAQIAYRIDNQTGALTVSEADYYKARMLVAQDGALSTPESGDAMLEKLPMGASRTLEGQRLRSAREHDLQLTIGQIDGVEAVRVHLAEAERSVFVRDNVAPTASVMVRLRSGRNLSQSQVAAIVNLVAGSVPGLSPDAVRVVDQHGQLLSEGGNADNDRLDMQSRLEGKLREQVSALLTPMLGEGRFTTETQVELNMDQVTAARESYDKDGVVRTEQQQQSQTTGAGQAGGVPGVLSNTPPPATQAVPGAPQGTPTGAPGAPGAPPQNGESSSSKTYELGRQVSVSETGPGGIKRLTVAVAISADALKGAKAQEIQDLQALVSAAVGADTARGDTVKIVTRAFSPVAVEETPFYETDWFAMIVRNGAAVLAVLLVLLLGVRPMVGAMRGGKPKKGRKGEVQLDDSLPTTTAALTARPEIGDIEGVAVEISRAELLARQLEIAQRLVAEKPDSAVIALRQMLSPPDDQKAA